MSRDTLLTGIVTAAFGRRFLVETEGAAHTAATFDCVVRGKRVDLACGDRVEFAPTSAQEGVIERIAERTNVLMRASPHRRKLIAANIDQVVVIVASEPTFDDELVARVLIAAAQQSLQVLVVLNKSDLPAAAAARARLQPFERSGYEVLELCAKSDVTPLAARIAARRCALVGQSGMGKSTIVNALVPAANIRTQAFSQYLDSGRHTTTATRLYRLDDGSRVIDCPGLQEFGLAHLGRDEIERAMPERRAVLGRCRFNDCRHDSEPGCALKEAVSAGAIDATRFALTQRILRAEAQR